MPISVLDLAKQKGDKEAARRACYALYGAIQLLKEGGYEDAEAS